MDYGDSYLDYLKNTNLHTLYLLFIKNECLNMYLKIKIIKNFLDKTPINLKP